MSRANASQPGLFDPPPAEPAAPRLPDPDFARKHLNNLIWQVARAERLPWSPSKTAMWEGLFPQLAEALPPDEARELCDTFAAELARLRLEIGRRATSTAEV